MYTNTSLHAILQAMFKNDTFDSYEQIVLKCMIFFEMVWDKSQLARDGLK